MIRKSCTLVEREERLTKLWRIDQIEPRQMAQVVTKAHITRPLQQLNDPLICHRRLPELRMITQRIGMRAKRGQRRMYRSQRDGFGFDKMRKFLDYRLEFLT